MSNEKPTTYELISWAYEDYKQAQNQPKPGGYEPPKKPKVIKDKDIWERYQGELEGWRNHQDWYDAEMKRIQTDIKRTREHLINAIPACGVWFKMADGMCVGKYVVVEWKLRTGRAEHDELVVRSYQKHMPSLDTEVYTEGVQIKP